MSAMCKGIWKMQMLELFSHQDAPVQIRAINENSCNDADNECSQKHQNLIIVLDDTTSSAQCPNLRNNATTDIDTAHTHQEPPARLFPRDAMPLDGTLQKVRNQRKLLADLIKSINTRACRC
jgi:hypothetical protein